MYTINIKHFASLNGRFGNIKSKFFVLFSTIVLCATANANGSAAANLTLDAVLSKGGLVLENNVTWKIYQGDQTGGCHALIQDKSTSNAEAKIDLEPGIYCAEVTTTYDKNPKGIELSRKIPNIVIKNEDTSRRIAINPSALRVKWGPVFARDTLSKNRYIESVTYRVKSKTLGLAGEPLVSFVHREKRTIAAEPPTARKTFLLPDGEYTITSSYDFKGNTGVATAAAEVQLKEGQTIEVILDFGIGKLVVSSVPFDGAPELDSDLSYTLWETTAKSDGTKKQVAAFSIAKSELILKAGTYDLIAKYHPTGLEQIKRIRVTANVISKEVISFGFGELNLDPKLPVPCRMIDSIYFAVYRPEINGDSAAKLIEESDGTKLSLLLQPGEYKIEYRLSSNIDLGEPLAVETRTVTAGEDTNILFAPPTGCATFKFVMPSGRLAGRPQWEFYTAAEKSVAATENAEAYTFIERKLLIASSSRSKPVLIFSPGLYIVRASARGRAFSTSFLVEDGKLIKKLVGIWHWELSDLPALPPLSEF